MPYFSDRLTPANANKGANCGAALYVGEPAIPMIFIAANVRGLLIGGKLISASMCLWHKINLVAIAASEILNLLAL